jgi:hypothetical protein
MTGDASGKCFIFRSRGPLQKVCHSKVDTCIHQGNAWKYDWWYVRQLSDVDWFLSTHAYDTTETHESSWVFHESKTGDTSGNCQIFIDFLSQPLRLVAVTFIAVYIAVAPVYLAVAPVYLAVAPDGISAALLGGLRHAPASSLVGEVLVNNTNRKCEVLFCVCIAIACICMFASARKTSSLVGGALLINTNRKCEVLFCVCIAIACICMFASSSFVREAILTKRRNMSSILCMYRVSMYVYMCMYMYVSMCMYM